MRLHRLLALVAFSMLAGCAIIASKGDYRDYRQVRAAEGDDRERALAMARYVTEHPEGRWAPEINEQRRQAEPVIYEATKSTHEGLAFYLEAYPDGTYVEQARQRLAALQTVQSRRQDETEAQRDVEREQRDAIAEQRRTWASRAVGFWTKTLVGISNWGSPIPQVAGANAEFNEAFGQEPRPRCSRSECIKFYALDFGIPVPGRTRVERRMEMMLRLRMDEGNLVRVEMLMPGRGFSRWYELENREFIEDFDPDMRQTAINWAVEKILPFIREVRPELTGIDWVMEPIDPPTVSAPNQAGEGAAGAEGEGAEGEGAEGEGAEGEEPMSFVIPIAIQAIETGHLRAVIFAAPDEDEGPAYDGFFIEHIVTPATAPEPEPEPPPRRRPRPRKRG